MADFERSTAKTCNIKDLVNGNFIKKEGWEPSYVSTEYGQIFRVNMVGVIVSKNSANDCIFDDGTGKIIIRSFTNNITSEIGDLVKIIGKPRIFNNELFVNAEIVKKIQNTKWVDYRKRELLLREKQEIKEKTEYIQEVKEEVFNEEKFNTETKEVKTKLNNAETIIKLIDSLDSGEGANIDDIISKSGIDNADTLIKSLMEEGEIFQIKPGKLKVM